MRLLTLPLLVLLLAAPASAATIHVPSGGNLQTALTNAASGDTITLEAGATFTGNFTLPAKAGPAVITVRTVTADGSLPAKVDFRTNMAATEPLMATVQTTNALPAILGDSGDAHWSFIGLIFEASNATNVSTVNILQFCDNTITVAANLCDDFTLDRVIVRAVSGGTALRGLQMQVKNMVIRNSTFYNIKSQAAESHTMSAFNSPGPFLIEDNYIAAAGIGVLFGGAAPAVTGLIQSDITFRRNYVTRDLALLAQTGWAVKNLFELKNAQRVTVSGNIFEHNWPNGQSGFAIVFTVRANSATGCPQCTVKDVLFENNIVRKTGAAFNILGIDNQSCGAGCTNLSTRMERVTIRNNLIYEVDRQDWPDPSTSLVAVGTIVQLDGAPEWLTIEDNTFMGAGSITGNIIVFSGDPLPGFIYQRNLTQKLTIATGWPYDSFGIFGSGFGEGNPAMAQFATNPGGAYPATVLTNNVIAGGTAATYNNWPGNLFPSVATLTADFVDPANGNFRLVGGSAYAGKGADQDAIEAAIAGDEPPAEDAPKRRFRWRRQ